MIIEVNIEDKNSFRQSISVKPNQAIKDIHKASYSIREATYTFLKNVALSEIQEEVLIPIEVVINRLPVFYGWTIVIPPGTTLKGLDRIIRYAVEDMTVEIRRIMALKLLYTEEFRSQTDT